MEYHFQMTPAERAAAIAAQARAKERDAKAENRRLMPMSAAFIDAFTEVFGKCPAGRFTEAGRSVRWGLFSDEK